MKSLPPLPLGALLGSESEVLPRPLDPMAVDVELVVDELDEDDGAVTGELLPGVAVPRRLVAAVNAEDAFGADVETDEVELELDAVDAAADVDDAAAERSRP